jgi:uncharacterized lipoprotein YehR (DUF1307 family)
MDRYRYISRVILAVVLTFSLSGCGGAYRGNLKTLNDNPENELKQNWNDYTVYKKEGGGFTIAVVYKIRDDKKIVLNRHWVLVTTADEMAKIRFKHYAHSAEILGQDNELYGYLVYLYRDLASVKIIDGQTVQLYYHHTRTDVGP